MDDVELLKECILYGACEEMDDVELLKECILYGAWDDIEDFEEATTNPEELTTAACFDSCNRKCLFSSLNRSISLIILITIPSCSFSILSNTFSFWKSIDVLGDNGTLP